MIVKSFRRAKAAEDVETKGFDAFELRLGDLMRGERATMGKSLLDVQRELKIKAAYIAAIENADPSAFDTPGFIAGYVRSYARYLHMDPDWAFDTFCRESGFATAHGMSAAASSVKQPREQSSPFQGKDIFASSATPFVPAGEAMFARVEPGAVGSMVVLLALIGGLGYGGWSVLQELQRVQFAPVEQTPVVLSDIDPLAGAAALTETADLSSDFTAPSPEALDRLYRPQALDVPVLVARDAPISTLRPDDVGTIAPMDVDRALVEAVAEADLPTGPVVPQVSEGPVPEVQILAVRPAWVRVRAADGSVIFEGILDKGDTFDLPATEEPATLRVGESGALYFAVNGTAYGPAGARGQVTSNLALSVENLTESFAVADLTQDDDLAAIVNVAEVAITE
ncbi:RodZ domain-containing protein [Yoonia sp. R2331]|uniref:RodZ domain-containing protein n=1 Tax=Yoonia sp. R2331 TaxID=3237238 RepID=UPI0034E5B309